MKKICGFILLAIMMLSCHNRPGIIVEVHNPTADVRINEMIELDYAEVLQRLGLAEDTTIIVLDPLGFQLFYQITFDNKLIFLSNPVESGMTAYYRIVPGVPDSFDICAIGAHIAPADDIVWENGSIAFALRNSYCSLDAGSGSGYDVWLKKNDYPLVVERCSAQMSGCATIDNAVVCCEDTADLLDYYEVGSAWGAGATALLDARGEMVYSYRSETFSILDNGPLRFTLSLRYAPIVFDGDTIVETRVITLDEGSQLNKVDVIYHYLKEPAQIVAGIALRSPASVEYDAASGYVANAILLDSVGTQVYMGVACESSVQDACVVRIDKAHPQESDAEEYLVLSEMYMPGETFTYYTGAGWSKWGFDNADDWYFYMRYYADRLDSPLHVSLR